MAEFRGRQILRDEVLKELAKFDEKYPDTNDYENWLNDGTYRFALKCGGRLYPPKYILSQITGLPVSEFSGGEETNRIFEELCFAVRDKAKHIKYWKIAPGQVARLWDRCIRDGNIAVGWNELGDLTSVLGSYSKLKDLYAKTYTNEPPQMRGRQQNQLWQFLMLTEGDIVVANKGITSLMGRGRVTGRYQYRDDYEEYKHIIPVEWFDTTERPVPTAAKDISAPFFGLTLKELTEEEYLRLFSDVDAAPELSVLENSDVATAPELSVLKKKKQIILYGPPGTGKTYSTKSISVSLLSSGTVEKARVWIFQTNPEQYRLVDALQDPLAVANMSWTVSRYKKQIHKGDLALIWFSGQNAGFYALAEITTSPSFIKGDPNSTKYRVDQTVREEEYLGVRIKIIKNLVKNPIYKDEIQILPGLENLSILKFFAATNFPVSDAEWNIIKRTFNNRLGDGEGDDMADVIPRDTNSLYEKYCSEKRIKFITFHPAYSYEEFIEGITVAVEADGAPCKEVQYTRKPGLFKELCKRALAAAIGETPDNKTWKEIYRKYRQLKEEKRLIDFENAPKYVLIIDEINRGDIAKIFGELITLLEADKRIGAENEIIVKLPLSEDSFGVPPNVYIIGTMNTADRSIALLDVALRRRFGFVEMNPNFDVLEKEHIEKNKEVLQKNGVYDMLGKSVEALKALNKCLCEDKAIGRDRQIGQSFLFKVNTVEDLDLVWKHEILPLMEEYCYGDYQKINKILFGKDEDSKWISTSSGIRLADDLDGMLNSIINHVR